MQKTSWDTALKHIARNGLLNDLLTPQQIALIPRSNIARWKKESQDKYQFCELNQVIQKEIELIKKLNQSSKIKAVIQSYFQLCQTFHSILEKTKNIKTLLRKHKEKVVNTIEKVKHIIPIENALQVFKLSRSTYENYKAIVVHRCWHSYFNCCVKQFSNQLLPQEVKTIKNYMTHKQYQNWSKACIYLKAIRDQKLKCSLATFYKYCRLLGFDNKKGKRKSDDYSPVKTEKPNQLWCADVTYFKTVDNQKHAIHFLMDHYSKKILGYGVAKNASAYLIKNLLEEAIKTHKPNKVRWLTDGGSENVNTTVSNFIHQSNIPIEHSIAQKDVGFSNAMVEALNKVIKHQFLYPLKIPTRNMLEKVLKQLVVTYNTQRPQWALGGNTPEETFRGTPIDFLQFSKVFKEQKAYRLAQNKHNRCKQCQ